MKKSVSFLALCGALTTFAAPTIASDIEKEDDLEALSASVRDLKIDANEKEFVGPGDNKLTGEDFEALKDAAEDGFGVVSDALNTVTGLFGGKEDENQNKKPAGPGDGKLDHHDIPALSEIADTVEGVVKDGLNFISDFFDSDSEEEVDSKDDGKKPIKPKPDDSANTPSDETEEGKKADEGKKDEKKPEVVVADANEAVDQKADEERKKEKRAEKRRRKAEKEKRRAERERREKAEKRHDV